LPLHIPFDELLRFLQQLLHFVEARFVDHAHLLDAAEV
jgi:hypothetical protein